jgi:hypothetical protein
MDRRPPFREAVRDRETESADLFQEAVFFPYGSLIREGFFCQAV